MRKKQPIFSSTEPAAGSCLPACGGFISQHGPAVSPSAPSLAAGASPGQGGEERGDQLARHPRPQPGLRRHAPAPAALGRRPGPHRAPGGGCVATAGVCQGGPSLAQCSSQTGNLPHLLHVAWDERDPDNSGSNRRESPPPFTRSRSSALHSRVRKGLLSSSSAT